MGPADELWSAILKKIRLFILTVAFSIFAVDALAEPSLEAHLRSAFVLQFLKYIEWPTPNKTMEIAVIDDSELSTTLTEGVAARSDGASGISISNMSLDDFKRSKSNFQVVVFPKNKSNEIEKAVA